MTIPLLGAAWYRAELARRDSLLDRSLVENWKGAGNTMSGICTSAARLGRPVIAAAVRDRRQVPAGCVR